MTHQLDHYAFKKKQIKFNSDIIIILENLEHSENIGSAFRLADAFNVNNILIVTKSEIDLKKISKTSRNCEQTKPYNVLSSIEQAIKIVEDEGYVPVCLEICDDSFSLSSKNFADFGKVAIIVGNERNGVSEKALELSKLHTHIDMFGNNSSMNVANALAIALYKISQDQFLKKNIIKDLEISNG